MSLTAEDGRKAALEDRAIGASFGIPDETLPLEYRRAYIRAWQQADTRDFYDETGHALDPPEITEDGYFMETGGFGPPITRSERIDYP